MREVSVADELRRPGFSETFAGYLHRWFGECDKRELQRILLMVSGWIWEKTVPKSRRIPDRVDSDVLRYIDLHGEDVHSPALGINILKRPSIKYAQRIVFQVGLAMRSVAVNSRARKFTCRPAVSIADMYSSRREGPVGYLCTFHQCSTGALPWKPTSE